MYPEYRENIANVCSFVSTKYGTRNVGFTTKLLLRTNEKYNEAANVMEPITCVLAWVLKVQQVLLPQQKHLASTAD